MSRALRAAALLAACACITPSMVSDAFLHPFHTGRGLSTDLPHRELAFQTEDGLTLRGWLIPAPEGVPRRGLLVWLHGRSDNRRFSVEVARRFGPKGFDVLAYDSRAHGASDGTECTYGYREKRDLIRALDAVGARSATVIGFSLGGSVVVQAAPDEPRIERVVAISPFADLTCAIDDRTGWISRSTVEAGIALAQEKVKFAVTDVSAVEAAKRIRVQVLLIHGAQDGETKPYNSQRIYDALPRDKRRLIYIDGAGHADIIEKQAVWELIESWVAPPP